MLTWCRIIASCEPMIAILLSLGMFVADLFKSRCRLEAENLEPAPRHLDRGALKAGRLGLCVVPTANPKRLTATANRLILAPDERSVQVDLVRLDRTVAIAGCVGSRDPCPSTPTQRAAAQISEAIGVRQY